VESNTIHPVGKAIVEAAQAASCTSVKVYMHLVEVFRVIILGKHGNKLRDVRVRAIWIHQE